MGVSVSEQFIKRIWYQKTFLSRCLFPLSILYQFIILVRRFLYQHKIFSVTRVIPPVIVVGNITVGGTGKTPLVIALVAALKKQGFHPGVISRGYGGKSKQWPVVVDSVSDPIRVGDEAVLIAKSTAVPVVVGPKRVDDVKKLLSVSACDVIVSDDGLQHYALHRDIEIAVIDSSRQCGNGYCLPAGPLREPASRLKTVDFIISNGKKNHGEFEMQFVIDSIVNLQDENKTINLSALSNQKIIAVAGIGNPDRFFQSLRLLGISFSEKIFPDHHAFQKSDFDFLNNQIIVMTEKDAVKCRHFCDSRFYVARGHAVVDDLFFQQLFQRLQK